MLLFAVHERPCEQPQLGLLVRAEVALIDHFLLDAFEGGIVESHTGDPLLEPVDAGHLPSFGRWRRQGPTRAVATEGPGADGSSEESPSRSFLLFLPEPNVRCGSPARATRSCAPDVGRRNQPGGS